MLTDDCVLNWISRDYLLAYSVCCSELHVLMDFEIVETDLIWIGTEVFCILWNIINIRMGANM